MSKLTRRGFLEAGSAVLAGAVFWASAEPEDSAAPPNSPAVPLGNVRRDTDCCRTVFSVIVVPPKAVHTTFPGCSG